MHRSITGTELRRGSYGSCGENTFWDTPPGGTYKAQLCPVCDPVFLLSEPVCSTQLFECLKSCCLQYSCSDVGLRGMSASITIPVWIRIPHTVMKFFATSKHVNIYTLLFHQVFRFCKVPCTISAWKVPHLCRRH